MAYQRPSIADVAVEIGTCLAEGDEAAALRLAFRCVELFERAPLGERADAREGILAPAWVEDSNRFLDQWWFVSGLRSLHADAIAHSPISFARRGVFITAGAVAYV